MLVRALGLKDYLDVWELQKVLVDKRLHGEAPDTLLLTEHLPVYTRGASSRAPIPPFLPHPLRTAERGGDITYHGPGQLVGYPIIHLGERALKVRAYLRTIEAVLIEALGPMGVEAETLRGFTGVWVKGKKLASIGVAVRGQVAYHGFALNVNTDLAPFRAIHPCNLEPEQMTSLERVLGRHVPMEDVLARVAGAFLSCFEPAPAARA